ncbi:MAG: hypothetical protein CM1200mP30_29810 [Pseudomonadota bacterium]|nr:MAG: hypothetical protein CM1200mP30_29810 [Pseudomonadota bacterium]
MGGIDFDQNCLKTFGTIAVFGDIISCLLEHYGEKLGKGDLRFFALVQFLPMLLIPLMLLFYGSCLSGRRWIPFNSPGLWAAKIAEMYDQQIYELIGLADILKAL